MAGSISTPTPFYVELPQLRNGPPIVLLMKAQSTTMLMEASGNIIFTICKTVTSVHSQSAVSQMEIP